MPVKNYLTEVGADGKEHPLPREKFYIPGSLLKANIDNTNPLAYGMPRSGGRVLRQQPGVPAGAGRGAEEHLGGRVVQRPERWTAAGPGASSIWTAERRSPKRRSAKARSCCSVRKSTFRAQPHATFKLLFNGLYYGSAKETTLP